MANPQKENGYTDIANEIMDALCRFRIPGEVRQIIDCIFRKTYGFHKKEDYISNSQLCDMTGMTKGNVSRSLSKAITHRIVIKIDNKLLVNKDYDEWLSFRLSKTITKKRVIKNETKVIKSETSVEPEKLSKVRDTKPITKPNNTKPNNTKVLGPEVHDKRNPELQSLIEFANTKQFSLQGSEQQNRRYAYNLIRKKDNNGDPLGERVHWLVEMAIRCRGKDYAPQINDFRTLFYKWQDLLSYVQKEKNGKSKNVIG